MVLLVFEQNRFIFVKLKVEVSVRHVCETVAKYHRVADDRLFAFAVEHYLHDLYLYPGHLNIIYGLVR